MKNCVAIAMIALLAAGLSVGCKPAGGCFSRNGSRVPTQSYAAQSAAPVQDQVIYSSPAPFGGGAGAGMGGSCAAPCSAVSQACEPCGPACAPTCGACDPCGTGRAIAPTGGYPTPGV